MSRGPSKASCGHGVFGRWLNLDKNSYTYIGILIETKKCHRNVVINFIIQDSFGKVSGLFLFVKVSFRDVHYIATR